MSSRVKLRLGERVLMYVTLILCATAYLSLITPLILFAARALASNNSTLMLYGVVSLLGVNLMMVTGALAYMWFRPHIKDGFKLDNTRLVINLITLYALSRICISVEPLLYSLIGLIQNYMRWSRWLLYTLLKFAHYLSGIIVGILILKFSSSLIRKPSIDNGNKRLVSLSLLGLSISAIIFTIQYALRPDLSINLFELVPYVLSYLSIGYLAFNVNKLGMLNIKQLLTVFLVWILSSLFVYFLQLRFEFFESYLFYQIWRMLKGSYLLYESIGLTTPIVIIIILAAIGIILLLGGYKIGKYPKIILSGSILLYALDNLASSNIFSPGAHANIITFVSDFLSATTYLISGTELDISLLTLSSRFGTRLFGTTQGIVLLIIGVITLKKLV